MKNLFTIGEMADLFGINIRTLRYYDEIGILHPETADPDTGYRYYSTRQFERLNTIKYLRALGVSLKKIALFFENRDVDIMLDLLKEQKAETQAKISELTQIEQKLEYRLKALEDAVHTQCGEIRTLHFDQRQIAYLRKDIRLGEDLEFSLRELERANTLEPVMFLGKVGVSLSSSNLKARKFESFSGIFVLLEKEDHFMGEEQYLQAGDYVSVRFSGTHREASQYYMQLLEYMDRMEYACCGDSVEITLIDAGFTNDTSRYVTEIQILYLKCMKE